MRNLLIFSLLILIISAFELDPCKNGTCSRPLTVTSFNVRALQGRTRNKIRALELEEFFANDTRTDILCLQEISPVVRRFLLSSLPNRWSHNFYASTNISCRGECDSDDLTLLSNCINDTNCGNNFTCIFKECGQWMLRLDEECQVCLADNSTESFQEQLNLCNEDNDDNDDDNDNDDDDACDNPVDNLILSIYPLNEKSFTSFDEDEKGILFAVAQLQNKVASLLCVSFREIDDDDDDDRSEQQEEVSLVVSRANSQNSDRLVFLMGDFKTSPDQNPSVGITDESFSILSNTLIDYTDIYVDCINGSNCTVFPNPLSNSSNSHTDHMFVRNDNSRCLANTTAIVSSKNLGGESGELYGLSIDTCSSGSK